MHKKEPPAVRSNTREPEPERTNIPVRRFGPPKTRYWSGLPSENESAGPSSARPPTPRTWRRQRPEILQSSPRFPQLASVKCRPVIDYPEKGAVSIARREAEVKSGSFIQPGGNWTLGPKEHCNPKRKRGRHHDLSSPFGQDNSLSIPRLRFGLRFLARKAGQPPLGG